ncbi:M67 family metallopeptidase [Thermococcus argininiproducens]|uniref:M67 family metallopeptidase n=1 Tax=Thermococcus argininiproducens TaxID=2866384 RepID=A0A9E7M8W7_9EURY|nr:M67 family metallopeptidase [Thermococcus argininiproducens]USG99278.1 M67 family metallopeptidase [Thermococcus argininiproducens]
MRFLYIKRVHLYEILQRAKESNVEICGFLLGQEHEDGFFVEEIVFTKNKLNSPVEFEVDPLETLEVFQKAETEELEIIGIFHSHVNCPHYPSGKDLKGMDLWRNAWLIVSTLGTYGAFLLKDGEIKEIRVVVLD